MVEAEYPILRSLNLSKMCDNDRQKYDMFVGWATSLTAAKPKNPQPLLEQTKKTVTPALMPIPVTNLT